MSEIQLPSHWKVAKLGDCCHKPDYGYTASATDKPTALKFLRITDIQDHFVNWDSVPYCEYEAETINRYLLQPGDIVIARIGATTGKAYFIKNCPQAIFASYLIRLRAKADLIAEFIIFYCQTKTYWKYIDQTKGGRLKGGVNIPILQNLILPLPPLSEQRAIAHTLRTIQKAKEARQRELELERERKAALMQYLFTYGSRNESTKQTLIGEIPESWQVVKLGDVCSITTGTTPSTSNPEYYSGSIPFVKTSEIINNRINKTETYISEQAQRDYNLKIYPPGTVFLAMYGQGKTRGQVAILEITATTTQNTAAIVPNQEIDSTFLWQWLMSQYSNLREAGSQGHISHLNLGYVKQYKFPQPATQEQHKIADILSICDRKIQALEKEISTLDELFRAMLEEVMTGRLSTQPLIEQEN